MNQTTSRLAVLLGCSLAFGSVTAQSPASVPPPTEVHPVTDTYFGTQVTDPYRWLENLDDPKVQDWMKQQASYAKGQLDAIHGRDAMLARIHALSNVTTIREVSHASASAISTASRSPERNQPSYITATV